MAPTLLQRYIDAGKGTNNINLVMADYDHYSSNESVEGIEYDILPLLCEIATKTKHKLKFNDEYLGK
ncbi:hypothetical protein GGI06_000386 [Coemansia sp. S85]|nr:hypothetical protein GGI06_000386 [Coemansia sp. S85]